MYLNNRTLTANTTATAAGINAFGGVEGGF